jgi:hypothetical protein
MIRTVSGKPGAIAVILLRFNALDDAIVFYNSTKPLWGFRGVRCEA